MTGEIGGHDVWPGPGLLSFFDKVGKRLIHERLKLPCAAAGEQGR